MKTMNTLLSVWFLMVAISDVSAQNVWQTQSSPVSSDLVSVSFTDNLHGWIATDDGNILFTENGGANWQTIAQMPNATPSKIFFRDTLLGWLTGGYNSVVDSAFILRTEDGGVTWQPVFQAQQFGLSDIFFINDTLGWTTGYEFSENGILSLIMHTLDGGDSWSVPFGPRVQNRLCGIHFRDNNYGEACGQDGLFFHTNSGGQGESANWSMNIAIPGFGKDLYGIYNSGNLYGCSVGEDGFVLVTKNKWTSYVDNYTSSGDTLFAVSGLPDKSNFWAVGSNGCIANIQYALWIVMISEEERITLNDLHDICVIDENHIWAVGEKGTIVAYGSNNPPVAADDKATVRQDTTIMLNVLENDNDPDNHDLRIYSYTEGNHGSVSFAAGNDYLVFDPDNDYTGMDTLQYVITDDFGGFDTARVYIEVIMADPGYFEEIAVNFDSVAFGNAIWGDIDRDRDYDILVCGEKGDGTRITSLYINQNGTFEKAMAGLEGVSPRNDRAMAFIDLNLDGYLDFIVTGENNSGNAVTRLYLYDFAHSFEEYYMEYTTGIPGVTEGSVDWGDYDNDGDLDLLISGKMSNDEKICKIFRNDGKGADDHTWIFTGTTQNFYPLSGGVARFVDFNRDGFLDVVAMGTNEDQQIKGYYYTNNEGLYIAQLLKGHNNGSVEYCDYDSDGKLEILLTGDTALSGSTAHTSLITFEQEAFSELDPEIETVSLSSADWGDFDNDGDYDLVISGMNEYLTKINTIYENTDNAFVNSGVYLTEMVSGTVRWGDYDNDGDLDILLSGYVSDSPNRVTTIYRNNIGIDNQPPAPPDNLKVEGYTTAELERVTVISWDQASDTETPADGLTYNVRIKRKKENKYLVYPPVHDDGMLKTSLQGSALTNQIINGGLTGGMLYTCQVQAVDASFQGSPWVDFTFNDPGVAGFVEEDFEVDNATTAAEWVDHDNDGDLDLFLATISSEGNYSSRIYPVVDSKLDTNYMEHEIEYFTDQLEFLDFNNDNLLDYSSGFTLDSSVKLTITGYGDTLIKTGINLGSYDWGDYENDGDMDLIVTGLLTGNYLTTKLYRNNQGMLENYNVLITGMIYGDVQWVDFDGDGDLDIAICGQNPSFEADTKIYENVGGTFIDTEMDLAGLAWSDMDFADSDNDGDLDLLICGVNQDMEGKTLIYLNENNRYRKSPYEFPPIGECACKWFDKNADGDRDFVVSGRLYEAEGTGDKVTKVYVSDYYIETSTLYGASDPVIALGDYSGDGNTDLYITGTSLTAKSKGVLYRNTLSYDNFKPSAPQIERIDAFGDSVQVHWSKSVDDPNYTSEMTYNLRVGNSPGGSQVISAMANQNGKRKVVGPGNAWNRTFSKITGLSPDSVYYLAVQSIDAAYLESEFSDEMVFSSLSGLYLPEKTILSDRKITNAAWIDYDSDGDLDLLIRNEKDGTSYPGIYRNDNGEIDTSIIEYKTISFTRELLVNDFDNDNDADLLLFPYDQNDVNTLLNNTDGSFSSEELGLTGLLQSRSAWGDFDNDGDEDLIIMGISGNNLLTYLYQNKNGVFESYDNLLEPVYLGNIKWVDLDNDGDKDIVRTGITEIMLQEPGNAEFIISENMGGAFRDIKPDIPGLIYSDMDFGDFDNDGDLDMLYTGWSTENNQPHTGVYSNENGTLALSYSFTPVFGGAARWIDLDSDGKLDFIVTGYNDTISSYNSPDAELIAEIYMNKEEVGFVRVALLETFMNPVLAVGDYNGDGRADIFTGGRKNGSNITGIIYENPIASVNTPPGRPTPNAAEMLQDSVRITWLPGSDKESSGLYYNLRIGTSPGGNDVLSALSHDDGTRKMVTTGNIQQSLSFNLKDISPSTRYYYSIQSIDKGYAASPWSDEMDFTTQPVAPPPTGLDDQGTGEYRVRVYPNPVRNEFQVEIELDKPVVVQIDLYNNLGQNVFSRLWYGAPGINQLTLAIQDEGIYMLKLLMEERVMTKKIIRID